MAKKNIPLTLRRPGVNGVGSEITFAKVAAANDYMSIPRRYPFIDIANYTALEALGIFRSGSKVVSTELGGSATTNTEGVLGFQLPPTEKLILLVRRTGVASTGTAAHTIVIKGSIEYGIPDTTITWAADETFVSGTKIYEIDLYNLGLFITGVAGEAGVSIKVTADESTPALEFALIARV